MAVVEVSDWELLLTAHKKCCDLTEAHNNIYSYNGPVPEPDEVSSDLDILKKWVESIRGKQKTVN